MPASWSRWAVLGDQFVDVTELLPSEHLVDKAARRLSTALAIDLVVFWMNFRASCSRVDRRRLHVARFVQARRLVEHKTVSRA